MVADERANLLGNRRLHEHLKIVGWSLRSGGWPLLFWQDDKPIAVCLASAAAPELAIDDMPIVVVLLSEHVPPDGRDDKVSQLQAGDVVLFGAQVES